MTAYYASKRRLRTLPRTDKILITLFAVMLTVALAVGVLNYLPRTGLTVQGTQEWYRGNEDNPHPEQLRFAKTPLELLDVTHPHLFFQTIMFFILCHIFSLSEVSDRWKVALYSVGFGSILSGAALPWLIRYVSGAFAPLMILSGSVMTLSVLVLLIVPLREMWWSRAPAQVTPTGERRRRRPALLSHDRHTPARSR